MTFYFAMINAWSLAWEVLNGTMDEEYPIIDTSVGAGNTAHEDDGLDYEIDLNLIDASKDLGLNRFKTFFKIILPLSVPGVVAGSLLVFIPVVGEFIIPEMLGGSDRLYYGKILWEEFFVNRNWPGASALAFSGIIILVLPIVIFQILYSHWSQKNEI